MHKLWQPSLMNAAITLFRVEQIIISQPLTCAIKTSAVKSDQALGFDITVNKNMVPFDTRSPFITSGIRIGTPAITSRGFKEAQMLQIVDWIDAVITHADNDQKIAAVKQEVNAQREDTPCLLGKVVVVVDRLKRKGKRYSLLNQML